MKCQCKTKNGKKCNRDVKENSKYCWQHQQCKTSPPGPQSSKKSPKKSPRKLTASEREIQQKYCRCIMHVKEKSPQVTNPYAVCSARIKRVTNSCKEFE